MKPPAPPPALSDDVGKPVVSDTIGLAVACDLPQHLRVTSAEIDCLFHALRDKLSDLFD